MGQLLFYQQTHQYERDGVRVPSVSEIMRFASREVYGNVDQYHLDNAADRGSRIHAACQALDETGTADIDSDIEPYIRHYIQFIKDYAPQYVAIEMPLLHESDWYAGTLDRVAILPPRGKIPAGSAIIDIKSSYRVESRLASAQLTAYAHLWQQFTGHFPGAQYILHLTPTGYKLRRFERDDASWNALLTIHNRFLKRGEFDPWKARKL